MIVELLRNCIERSVLMDKYGNIRRVCTKVMFHVVQ